MELLLAACYWPKMQADLQDFVDGCSCSRMKEDIRPRNKDFGHIVAQYPIQLVAIDLFEYDAYQYFTALDVYSGFPLEVLILSSKTMSEVETAYKTLLAQFGEPEFVLSDRGSEFNFLPGHRLRTSAEHPEGNSKLERFHKELIKISRVHGLPPMHAVRYLQTDEKRSLFVNGRREQGRALE